MSTFAERFEKKYKSQDSDTSSFAKRYEASSGGINALNNLARDKQNQQQQKLDFTNQQTEQSVQDFQNIQDQGGWKGALNKFLGIGKNLPTLAGETPEYTQSREASEQKKSGLGNVGSFVGKLATIHQGANLFAKPEQTQAAVDIIKPAAGVLVEGEKQLGEGLGEIQNIKDIAKIKQQEVMRNVTLQKKWVDELKQTQNEERKKVLKASISAVYKKNQEVAESIKTDLTEEEKRKLWAGVIETGIDIGTAGLSTLLKAPAKTLFKQGTKQVVKKVAKKEVVKKGLLQTTKKVIEKPITEGAIFGGVYGVTGKAFEDGETLTAKEYAKSGAIGAGLGLTLVGSIGLIFSKLGKKAPKLEKAMKEKKVTQKEIEDIFKDKGITGVNKKVDELEKVVEPVVETKKGVLEVAKEEKLVKKGIESDISKAKSEGKSFEEFVETQDTPETINVWSKSKFSSDGGYVDVPVIRKEENITLYQGGEGRQYWTPNKKYAERFGKVKEKTGDFYQVENGNRLTDVYVSADKTKSQLKQLWEGGKKVEPKQTPKIEAKIPTKPSKIARSIEAKAIEQKLTTGFGEIAEFTPIKIKAQAEKTSKLFSEDLERAKRLITGAEELPSDINGVALITAGEEMVAKTGDIDLAYKLANSPLVEETSVAGQTLRLARERTQDSATNRLKEIRDIKRTAFEKKKGKVGQAVNKEKAKIKDTIKKQIKPTKETWGSFIDAVKC